LGDQSVSNSVSLGLPMMTSIMLMSWWWTVRC